MLKGLKAREEGRRVKTQSLLNFHPSENRCTSGAIGSEKEVRRLGEGGHCSAAEIMRPQCLRILTAICELTV
jgi:hypothetical protein